MSGISKLIIKAYGDEGFSSEKGEFSASLNPANLKITSSLDYAVSQAMGANSLALRYNVSPPRVLSFKLLFDNTGIFPDSSAAVKDQLDSLQSIIYNFQDDVKEPYYIRVIWGTIDFKGKLVGLETSYTLFQADGSPSRAEADIVILEQVSPAGAAKSQQAQSSNSSTDNSSSGGSGGSNPSNSSGANASSDTGNSSNSANNNTANSASNTGSGSGTTSDTSDTNPAEDANNPSSAADSNTDANSAGNTDNSANPEAANNEAANNGEQSPSNEANNQQAANEEQDTPNSTNSTTQETQAGDTLPAVANKNLGDPNLAKDLAKLNALDSLRDLAAGLKLSIPSLGVAALLAALLAMAKKYAKKGVNYIKKKAKAGEQKAVQLKNAGEQKGAELKHKVTGK
jgi:hypothetical protein